MGVEEVKTEPSDDVVSNGSDDPSPLEAKIIKQIEFYFGDYNIGTDRFMLEQIKIDDGWIPLETLLTFNRLRNLSTEEEVIIKALKKATNKLVVVSEDGKKLRRNPDKPLPERTTETFEQIKMKSVYLKGFPLESTIDELMDFFDDKGNILKVYMRKRNRKFKGSVFLTFNSKEEAEEFMKIEPLTYKETDIAKELSVDYHARKDAIRQKKKEEQEKRKLEREKKEKEMYAYYSSDDESFSEVKIKEEPDTTSKIEVKGCILKLTGLPEKITWEAIRKVFGQLGNIAFVEYMRGTGEAIIRFRYDGEAQKAIDTGHTKGSDPKTIDIDGVEVGVQAVEGEEEEKYWTKLYKLKVESRKKKMHPPSKRNDAKKPKLDKQSYEYYSTDESDGDDFRKGIPSSNIEVRDCILKLTELPETMTWEAIRKVFGQLANIAFVEYTKGSGEAIIRFRNEGEAKKALEAGHTKGSDPKTVNIDGAEVQMQVVQDDDEEQYWTKLQMLKAGSRKKKIKPQGGGGSFRGKGRNRRRGMRRRSFRSRDRGEPPSKVARTD